MGSVKAWKAGEAGSPKFPSDYEVVRKAVLQVTDLKSNHNKYYALELHRAQKGSPSYRVYTHYGRTDDLERNPDAGQKECRYFTSEPEALGQYETIYREKTSARKGYKELSLASSKIGSEKTRGQSAGHVDEKTLAKLAPANDNSTASVEAPKSAPLAPAIDRLVKYLYAEATHALTTTVQATITAKGIETPLGVLTVGQIEKGETILQALYELFQKGKPSRSRMLDLSGEFYTVIPHRLGRSRADIEAAAIDSLELFHQRQETLQLMKDMLAVNGERGGVLHTDDTHAKLTALGCKLVPLESKSDDFAKIKEHVLSSQLRGKKVSIKNVFALEREGEWTSFNDTVGNEKLLFHGSRAKNWVGILSRGLVLPKIAVSMGVHRTDEGWLGNGIYFGDAACTAAQYAAPGREGTSFLAVARVALGKSKDYKRITYGLTAPPSGFHSCHGVRRSSKVESDFDDDEFVVYASQQQRLEYLVEFVA